MNRSHNLFYLFNKMRKHILLKMTGLATRIYSNFCKKKFESVKYFIK